MGCSADDTTPTPTSSTDDDVVPTPSLSELQDETMELLTDKGEPKVWKVKSAKLTNGNATLDISSNFNVVDDEVVFYEDVSDNMIEWRRGHDIEIAASTAEETLLDYYRSSISSALSFDAESSTNLTSSEFDIEVSENNTITLKFGGSATAKNKSSSAKENDGELVIELEEKQASDYKVAPESLTFSETFTFEGTTVQSHAAGMIGSYSDNSFFYVTREDGIEYRGNESVSPERVIRFDLDDNSQSEYANYDEADQDFVSKQLHIINNQLVSIGGTKISTYDFDLSEPTTATYTEGMVSQQYGGDIAFTRFGMAVQDDAAYIIGGAFDFTSEITVEEAFSIQESKNVYKYDLNTQALTYFATLPEGRYGARGTIVNDKMYIFGGSTNFKDNSTLTNTIYIVNMNDPDDIQTMNMPEAIGATFVQKDQNLIYVTGRTRTLDEDPPTFLDTTFWVFDTLENSFEEITHNLTNPNGGYAVHQMTLFNGKMYVLFGDSDESLGNEDNFFKPLEEWTIYSADLE